MEAQDKMRMTMKSRQYIYRRRNFPFGFFLCGLFLMMFVGWKVLFLIPLFMMFGFWGSRGYAPIWESEDIEKPKRKLKNDEWDDTEIV